jgi:hypothetical protein
MPFERFFFAKFQKQALDSIKHWMKDKVTIENINKTSFFKKRSEYQTKPMPHCIRRRKKHF